MTRFGLHLLSGTDRGVNHLAGLAAAAEGAGFDTIWISDRWISDRSTDPPSAGPVGPGPPEPALEATTLLGALAVLTSRIRLGALVTDLTARNPAVLAKIITTLDVIAEGRSVLGFCHSPGPAGGTPTGVLEESVRICRAMFTGDDVSFAGAHFSVDHARNLPHPVQAGGPRILVGPGHDDLALDLVARYADQYGVSGDASTLSRAVSALRRHCREIGRDPAEIDVVWFAPCVLLPPDGHRTAGSPGRADGELTGAPAMIPPLVADHLAAGADEVIFRFSSVSPDGIAALGTSLGLDRS